MNDSTNSGPAPGWYRDPAMPGRLRWWDGSAWTGQTRDPAAPPAAVLSAAASAPVAVPPAATAVQQQQQTAVAPPRPTVPPIPAAVPVPAVPAVPAPAPLAASPAPLSAAPALPPAPQQEPVVSPFPPADPFALMAAATGSIKVIPPTPQQPAEPEPETRRGRLGLVLGLAAAILVVAGGIAVLLLDPFGLFPEKSSTDYSDRVELALKASIEATAEGDVTVESVSCPDALEPGQAEEFPCDVLFGDGSTLEIVAHATEDGSNIQWTPAEA